MIAGISYACVIFTDRWLGLVDPDKLFIPVGIQAVIALLVSAILLNGYFAVG